jgi:hypothetical protein
MQPSGQVVSQKPQPMHWRGRMSAGKPFGPSGSKQLTGQAWMQMPQAMHASRRMAGAGQSERGMGKQARFSASLTARCGQMRPQAPQSMHRSARMTCSLPRLPPMASTGQIFRQAVHPSHATDIA